MRKKDKIMYYSIGQVGYFYSNYIKYLGNSIFDVVSFVFGKTLLNRVLFNYSFLYNVFNTNKIKPIGLQILIGQSFYFIKHSFMLFNKISNYVKNNYNNSWCNNLFSNVSYLNYLNINHIKKLVFNNVSSLYFLNHVDDYNYLKNLNKKNNYVIYRGSFLDEGVKYSNLIFPMATFFEENLSYKSFSGLNVKTRKVVSTNIYKNKDFFFFLNNLLFKIYKSNIFSVINFKILYKYFKFLYINFNCINYSLYKKLLLPEDKKYKLLLENKIFNSLIINYYKTDVYSKNSKNISLASLEYLKTIITYIK